MASKGAGSPDQDNKRRDNAEDKKQKRIKANRESAARSKQRRQQLQNELEENMRRVQSELSEVTTVHTQLSTDIGVLNAYNEVLQQQVDALQAQLNHTRARRSADAPTGQDGNSQPAAACLAAAIHTASNLPPLLLPPTGQVQLPSLPFSQQIVASGQPATLDNNASMAAAALGQGSYSTAHRSSGACDSEQSEDDNTQPTYPSPAKGPATPGQLLRGLQTQRTAESNALPLPGSFNGRVAPDLEDDAVGTPDSRNSRMMAGLQLVAEQTGSTLSGRPMHAGANGALLGDLAAYHAQLLASGTLNLPAVAAQAQPCVSNPGQMAVLPAAPPANVNTIFTMGGAARGPVPTDSDGSSNDGPMGKGATLRLQRQGSVHGNMVLPPVAPLRMEPMLTGDLRSAISHPGSGLQAAPAAAQPGRDRLPQLPVPPHDFIITHCGSPN